MKNERRLVAIIVIVCLLVAFCAAFTGCSASFKRGVKDFTSEYTGGLNRTVTVYSMTGDKIGEWRGKIDIEADDTKVKFDLNGKRTIIYNAIVIAQED